MKKDVILNTIATTLFVVLMMVEQVIGQTQTTQNQSVRKYHVIDLGVLGIGRSIAKGINNNGEVVGLTSNHPEIGVFQHAFLYKNGVMNDLGALYNNSYNSYAYGINDQGQIVGYSEDLSLTKPHAFLYSNGLMQDLGTLGGLYSAANAINNQGQIVGWAHNTAGQQRAFTYLDGHMQDLGTPGESSGAFALNKYGHIVGWFRSTNATHAFSYSNGFVQDMGTLGGIAQYGVGINDAGYIITQVYPGNGRSSSFLYSNGSTQNLGTLGAPLTRAYGINNHNEIVGASSPGSGMTVRAFVYSNGVMKDLNDLLVMTNSGWTLTEAIAINDAGQIVGSGVTPAGQGHAFLLNPLPAGSLEIIQADTSRQTLGNIATPSGGKNSLVFITHGRIPPGDNPITSTAWVDSMSNSISGYLATKGINNWHVQGYKWIEDARPSVFKVLENAKQHGVELGRQILSRGYTHVYLIAHSAGAGLIQSATDIIKSNNPSVIVHQTFLDPFVGAFGSEASRYGIGANWADNYFTRDHGHTGFGESLPFTEFIMPHTYNVDVTQLDLNNREQQNQFVTGIGTPCYKTTSTHDWPISFYSNTIVGNVSSEYEGYGFPLSEIGGNWSYATGTYFAGNGRFGNPVDLKRLGTPDPYCFLDIPLPLYPSEVLDLFNSPALQSSSGTIEKYANGSIKATTGSPVWVAAFIMVSDVVNIVSFEADFQSTNNAAEGLLSVYWDDENIGSIDERLVQPGFQTYTFRFSNTISNSQHMLGFRLDPFSSLQSIVVVTNVITTARGVTLLFSISSTGMTNGLKTYQLTGQPGFEYSLQASSNLLEWVTIASLLNTNGTVSFYDKDSTNHAKRFYRVVAPY